VEASKRSNRALFTTFSPKTVRGIGPRFDPV
jgi:hypothetical protein